MASAIQAFFENPLSLNKLAGLALFAGVRDPSCFSGIGYCLILAALVIAAIWDSLFTGSRNRGEDSDQRDQPPDG